MRGGRGEITPGSGSLSPLDFGIIGIDPATPTPAHPGSGGYGDLGDLLEVFLPQGAQVDAELLALLI